MKCVVVDDGWTDAWLNEWLKGLRGFLFFFFYFDIFNFFKLVQYNSTILEYRLYIIVFILSFIL